MIAEEKVHISEKLPPTSPSTPSTADASAIPSSIAFSSLDIASYRQFVMSSIAITSPFSTTGRGLNFPKTMKDR
jgi:hypothetical protein